MTSCIRTLRLSAALAAIGLLVAGTRAQADLTLTIQETGNGLNAAITIDQAAGTFAFTGGQVSTSYTFAFDGTNKTFSTNGWCLNGVERLAS